MSPLEAYYRQLPERFRETMLAARDLILAHPAGWTPRYKWRCPTFEYRGRHVGHLYHNRGERRCYLGLHYGARIDHPLLVAEGRRLMRMLPLSEADDLPADAIDYCIGATAALLDARELARD